uniref:Uncharacterized protein n=1 Tax=Anguilla anguilla TaxID=7936 RepID=A0A0E9XLU4_ANGAN
MEFNGGSHRCTHRATRFQC